MNPAQSSILTSIGMVLSSAIATWAATHGIIHASDQLPITDAIATVLGAAATGALGWYKTRTVTPQAMIDAVNSPYVPGRKVVSEGGVSPKVNTPLKEKGEPPEAAP